MGVELGSGCGRGGHGPSRYHTVAGRRAVNAAEAVGRTLAALGVRDAFGVLGSGNFVATQALHAAGAAFHHARHEGGAICDGRRLRARERPGRRLQRAPGPGLHERAHRPDRGGQEPHAAARARRRGAARGDPLELPRSTSRPRGDARRGPRAHPLGRDRRRRHRPGAAPRARWSGGRWCSTCRSTSRREPRAAAARAPGLLREPERPAPAPEAVAEVAELIAAARRPLIVAGRGAVLAGAREPLERLGDAIGAVLATSAMGHGLFEGSPWAVGISGGFASPIAARLIGGGRPRARLRRRR